MKWQICALHTLMQPSFTNYVSNNIDDDTPINFEEWRAKRKADSPQFLNWFKCLELELLVLSLLHSLRTGYFDMYLNSTTNLVPCVFGLNHNKYARWLSVHVRDMCPLEAAHPGVLQEFRLASLWCVFSSKAIDQGHEQNAIMKDYGGIVGLTQNPDSLFILGFGWSWNHSHHIWIWIFDHRQGVIWQHQPSCANTGTLETIHTSSQIFSSSDTISRESLREHTGNKQRVLMHGHQGWNVRHGLCHIYMIYVYIWVVYSFCLFCCLFIIVTTQFVALYKPCKPKPKFR